MERGEYLRLDRIVKGEVVKLLNILVETLQWNTVFALKGIQRIIRRLEEYYTGDLEGCLDMARLSSGVYRASQGMSHSLQESHLSRPDGVMAQIQLCLFRLSPCP